MSQGRFRRDMMSLQRDTLGRGTEFVSEKIALARHFCSSSFGLACRLIDPACRVKNLFLVIVRNAPNKKRTEPEDRVPIARTKSDQTLLPLLRLYSLEGVKPR